jgi:HK97 family phage major capsid protein
VIVKLTHQQAVNREKDIQEELERLKDKNDKTALDHAKVPNLLEEFRSVHAHRLDMEHDAALAEVRSASTGQAAAEDNEGGEDRGEERQADIVDRKRFNVDVISGKYRDPWKLTEVRTYGREPEAVAGELRSRAFDAIERMEFADQKVREAAARYVQRDGDDTPISKLVLSTTSPDYTRAFIKMVRSRGQSAALLPDEAAAMQRAMSLTDNAGGFLVPFQLDPAVINTATGSVNEIRQISRVVTAIGDVWNGVSSAGVTGSWDGEAVEVSDDSPTLAQPSIPVYKLQVFVPLSHEVQMDAIGIADDIANMISFETDAKESVAFATGSGSSQPTGIITALTGGSSVVPSAGSDTFAVGDVYALDGALPQRFARNASWLAHRKIYNKMRQFDTAGGAALWGYLDQERKRELLGRPDYISEAMDSAVDAGQENYVLLFGDFQNYVVVDRLGTTMSYIPHLFGSNGRPTGQAGWHAWVRRGGDSVNDGAFRLLNVT